MIEDPDALRERVEQQARAEREALSLERTGRDAQRTHEWLAKLYLVEDNYGGQQGEGLITMMGLRETKNATC